MKVKYALEMLGELNPESTICIQWYEQEDMEVHPEKLPVEVWNLAVEIVGRYESMDYHTEIEQAIDEAYHQLGIPRDGE